MSKSSKRQKNHNRRGPKESGPAPIPSPATPPVPSPNIQEGHQGAAREFVALAKGLVQEVRGNALWDFVKLIALALLGFWTLYAKYDRVIQRYSWNTKFLILALLMATGWGCRAALRNSKSALLKLVFVIPLALAAFIGLEGLWKQFHTKKGAVVLVCNFERIPADRKYEVTKTIVDRLNTYLGDAGFSIRYGQRFFDYDEGANGSDTFKSVTAFGLDSDADYVVFGQFNPTAEVKVNVSVIAVREGVYVSLAEPAAFTISDFDHFRGQVSLAEATNYSLIRLLALLGMRENNSDRGYKLLSEFMERTKDLPVRLRNQAYEGLAILSLRKGQLDSAASWIERTDLTSTPGEFYFVTKITLDRLLNSQANTLPIIQAWMKAYPESTSAATVLANYYSLTGDWRKAIENLEFALKVDNRRSAGPSRRNLIHAMISLTLAQYGQCDEAYARVAPALAEKAEDSNLLSAYAAATLCSGDLAKAEQLLLKASRLAPGHPDFQQWTAVLRFLQGDFDSVIAIRNKLGPLVGANSILMRRMGDYVDLESEHSRKDESFRRLRTGSLGDINLQRARNRAQFLEFAPHVTPELLTLQRNLLQPAAATGDPLSALMLVRNWSSIGDRDAALRELFSMRAAHGREPWWLAAHCEVLSGQTKLSLEERIAACETARAGGANFSDVADSLSSLYWNSGNRQRSLRLIQEARSANPAVWLWALRYGFQLDSAGRANEALPQYDFVLQASPFNFIALNNKAWILGQQGRLDAALPLAQAATRLFPDTAEVWHTLGWLLLHQGRPVEAKTYLERANRMSPNPQFRCDLVETYRTLGQLKEAEALATNSSICAAAGGTLKTFSNPGQGELGSAANRSVVQ